ncbi:MAG: efflux RND transporter periplasmic adaptor subunit [Sphingomonadales bacterium]
MIKKIFLVLLPVLILGLGVVAVMGLHTTKPAPKQNQDEQRPVSLFVGKVRVEDVSLPVRTQGEVRPRTEIDLVAQVSGRIVSVSPSFVDGGPVEAGKTIIKIEDTDYRLEVTRAEARVAEARTQVALRQASAEIARRNWDDSIVGKPTALALKQPQLAEARARLLAAKADLTAARLNLERTNVSVPFNGRVRTKSVDVGQFVTAGLPLGRVYSTEIAEVRLPLTDAQLATLGLPIAFEETTGNGPKARFSAVVAGEERLWHGRIVRTEAAIDVGTRVLYAVAEVEAPYGAGADHGMPMAVGLFVLAEIEGRSIRNAYVVPRAALRSGNRIFVITDDATLDIRMVDVVYSDRDRVVLAGGVRPGEQVVVSPVRSPRQGMKVVALERDADRRVGRLTKAN